MTEQIHAEPGADLAAEAARLRQGAAGLREAIASRTEETRAELDEIQRQIEGLQAKAKSLSAAAGAENTAGDRQAGDLEQRAGWLDSADAEQARAAELDTAAAALEHERAELLEQVTGLGVRLGELAAEHQAVEADLTKARQAADVDRASAAQTRLEAVSGVISALESTRDGAQQRLAELGDETGGLLAEARNRASAAHESVARILRIVYPDSAEAQAWRARAELEASLRANLERMAGEQRAAQPRRQAVVRI